jgi:adenine-specific DNA-methyltransferase
MIYIDPPYNTGSDFVYKDNFAQNSEAFKEDSGQIDEYNQRLVVNPETAGRFHSEWLTMIYPRLKLARNLLTEDGVILISIDDHELNNLRKICDEIFGEVNFIANLIWEKGRKNDSRFFSVGHEYILVYTKDKMLLREKNVYWREEKPGAKEIHEEYLRLKKIHKNDFIKIEGGLKDFYSNLPITHPSKKHARYSNVDERGVWRDDNMSLPRGGAIYDVIHPVTGLPCAVPPGGWRYANIEKMQEKIKEGFVVFRKDHTEPPIRKTYLLRIVGDDEVNDFDNEEVEESSDNIGMQVAGTYFYRSGLQATNELKSIFGKQKIFNNPKDREVLERLINYCTNGDKNAIICDFFAGSGTTAHAVLQLNLKDNGNRKFICIQIPEATPNNKEAYNAGYLNISQITKERIRRVGIQIQEDIQKTMKDNLSQDTLFKTDSHTKVDTGFRSYILSDSNMHDIYYRPQDYRQDSLELFADNVKEDRTSDDLLVQVMLDWGLPLSLKIEQLSIGDKQVFKVAGNSLMACFDKGVDEDFAKKAANHTPLRIVFRDSSFKDDTAKENVRQLLKQLSPETEMRVI